MYKRYLMINMFLYIYAINSFIIEKTRDWSIKSQVNSKCGNKDLCKYIAKIQLI